MPVTLINGYVLLPDKIDWSTSPAWQRQWQTGITTALTGDETRQSVRALGRESLAYVISALTLEDRAELDERLDAASKAGVACAPFWGRASMLQANVTSTAVTLTDSTWSFSEGDYVFFMDAFGNWETAQIATIDPIVLSAPVGQTFPAGGLMWPMLFGKFKMEKQSAITSWHGDVKVTLSELVAPDQAMLGTAPKTGVGIGSMIIGSTFVVG